MKTHTDMIEKKIKALYETFQMFPELYQSYDINTGNDIFYLKDNVVADQGEDLAIRLNAHGVEEDNYSIYDTVRSFMFEWIVDIEMELIQLTAHTEWPYAWKNMQTTLIAQEPISQIIMRISPKTEALIRAALPKPKCCL